MNAFLINNQSTETSTKYTPIDYINKPIIIYYFINPFCEMCWNIRPILKKITMEYGAFCSIRPVINHSLLATQSNLIEKGKQIADIYTPTDQYTILLAIKAAALQGNKTGRDYLRNIQDYLFLYEEQESVEVMIKKACDKTNIDIHEFDRDLFSVSAKKAYESDVQLAQEMEVKQFPTLVFLSQHIDDYSMKVADMHSYETYTFVLEKMLELEIMERSTPSFEDFLKLYKRFKTEEIAFVFDVTVKEAEKSLKKLQLMQKIKRVDKEHHSFWEIHEN